MSAINGELRENLAALLAAQRELSADDQPYLIESFLDDVERHIEEHVIVQLDLQRAAGGRERQITYVRVAVEVLVAFVIAVFVVGVALRQNTGLIGLAGFAALLLLVPLGLRAFFRRSFEPRYIQQEHAWVQEGRRPPVVVRAYNTDRDFQRDATRLLALGYEIKAQQKTGDGTHVTYVTSP
jgi:hypothetical protein